MVEAPTSANWIASPRFRQDDLAWSITAYEARGSFGRTLARIDQTSMHVQLPVWTVAPTSTSEHESSAMQGSVLRSPCESTCAPSSEASGVSTSERVRVTSVEVRMPKLDEQAARSRQMPSMARGRRDRCLEHRLDEGSRHQDRHDAGATHRPHTPAGGGRIMSDVGQIERKAQERVVKLFQEQLGYEYLGNWEYREGNSNVEIDLLDAESQGSRLRRQPDQPDPRSAWQGCLGRCWP